jgi:Fe-S-cluster containining protein
MIEADRAQALDRHDFSAYPELAGKTFYHKPSDGRKDYFQLSKGEGTRCLFLGGDGLCIIHKEMGPEAKPSMCRQFPFLPVQTSKDDRVSVNFGCSAVQEHSGQLLSEQIDEISATVGVSKGAVDSDAPIPLDRKCLLTQAEGDALIDRIFALFDDRHAGNVWTAFAEALDLLHTVRACKSQPGASSESADLLGRLRSDEPLLDAPTVSPVQAFRNPAAAPMPARMLFAATLYPDTVAAGATSGTGFIQRLMQIPKLMTLATLSGGYASRLLGRNVSITQVLAHEVDAELGSDATALLLRYYRSRFWQRMMVGTKLPIVGGVHQHICDLNAILFMARAEAAAQNKRRMSADLIRQALTRVEFHLANQVRLYDHTLKGWFTSQLCDLGMATQSLRLMALQRLPEPAEQGESS